MLTIIKRTGDIVPFDQEKITTAISKSFSYLGYDKNTVNTASQKLSNQVTNTLKTLYDGEDVSISNIQDIVYDSLMASPYNDVAKAYIAYAEQKNATRKTPKVTKIQVRKKSGRLESWNPKKLEGAIQSAASETIDAELMQLITSSINKKVQDLDTNIISTEKLHDLVELTLDDLLPAVYDQYSKYRRYKKDQSESYDKARKEAECILLNGDNENAAKNSQLNSTKQALTAEGFMKSLMLDFELSPAIRNAHEEGFLYIHDLGARHLRQTNCCLFDMGKLLKDGFFLTSIDYIEPKSVSTALAVIGDVTLQASAQQYGGFTIPELDSILAPYAVKSFNKHKENLSKLLDNPSKIEQTAKEYTIKDIKQGIQGFETKLNTVSSALGQVPFVTVTFGLNTSFWGREISKAILENRIDGLGRNKTTAVFPKLVMMMRKEINRDEGSPNKDIYDMAVKCSSKRLYPDYLSLDGADIGNNLAEVYERSGKAVGPMGCVAPWENVQWNEGVTSIKRMWDDLAKKFPVKTQPDGINEYIDLEGIVIADSHTGQQEFVTCKRMVRNQASEWLEVKTKSGRVITCTPDHPFYIKGVGRVLAENLEPGMEVLPSKMQERNDNTTSQTKIDEACLITEIKTVHGPEYSYDVTTESDFFDVSGIVSHNCRAYLSPYFDGQEEIYVGRGNMGAVSLNLPKLAIESNQNLDRFYELIDHYTALIWKFHKNYHYRVGKQKGSTNPLFYCEGGAWKTIGYDDEIAPVIEAFTSSLGYIGLEETVQALTGKSLLENQNLALEIVKYLSDNAKQAQEDYGILTALYSTPAESYCYKAQTSNKEYYGEIENVTTREYMTNSFHIPVWEPVTVPQKIAFEEPFHRLATGGRISYNEFPYGVDTDVLQESIDFAMDNGLYYGCNIVSTHCFACNTSSGSKGTCSNCGSSDLQTVARVCGYLSFSKARNEKTGRFNKGKQKEILDRVKHINIIDNKHKPM